MNHTKKVLTAVLVVVTALVLFACKKPEATTPVFSGVSNKSIEVGETFDKLAGVMAMDGDTDLTDKIVVVGEVDNTKVGVNELKYSVENAAGKKANATRLITVTVPKEYANGAMNYKFADSDVRNAFFGAAEKHLLDNVYGGVPLFVNSGMSIYSSRVALPVQSYVPVMGWGSTFGTLTKDDAGLKFSDGSTGKAGEKTYRGAFSSNPNTFNHWISDDSVSSDALSFMIDSLYSFQFNDTNTGYEVKPSMAAAAPTAIGSKSNAGGRVVSKKWSVPIKEGLEFNFHPETDEIYKADKNITAQTFVDTFKYAIDNNWFRAIAGGSHFWSTSTPIKGAKAYKDAGATGNWDNVGLQVSADKKAIEFEFDIELSEWNLSYWLSSNTMSPVHLGMARGLGASYGTTPKTTATTGPYMLTDFQSDKVLKYKANDKFHTKGLYNYTGYNFVIIERAEIIFAEFEAGKLDAAGVPLTKYEAYKNNNGVRRSPGATTFRMNINGLGTQAAQGEQFPNSSWEPEPILANKAFRQALYFGVDRKTLAYDVLKTSDPGMFLFSSAYLVDPESGVAFRDTEEGKKVGEGLAESTYGYNPDAASALFKQAVAEGIASGDYTRGTIANPTVIEMEVAVQAGSTAQAQLGEFIKATFENKKLFYDNDNHVKISITVLPVEFPGIYYDKQLVGEFDLGMGGISGSALDAASFLEVFSSDNRGGFTLNWGFDTSIANIEVSYIKPETGLEVHEVWSFDAIVSVLNGDITVANGVEVLNQDAINNLIELIDALPSVDDLTLEHKDQFDQAVLAYSSLTPRALAAVTNLDKLFELDAQMDKLVDNAKIADLNAAIAQLPETATAANEKVVTDLVTAYKDIANKASVVGLDKLITAYTQVIDALIVALPETIALTDQKAISSINAHIKSLDALLGKDDEGAQKPNALTKKAELKAAVDALKVLTDEVAVADVEKLINELDYITLLPENEVIFERFVIEAARKAYNALGTQELKDEVSNIAKLVAHEARLKPLVDAEDAANFDLVVKGLPNINNLDEVHRVLVNGARAAYEALSTEAKAIVAEKYPTALETLVEYEQTLDAE